MAFLRRRRSVVAGALLAALVLLVSSCQVDATLDVVVDDDGSGEVRVEVALDQAAFARIPDLGDQLAVDDLVATGWTVTAPEVTDDGGAVVVATKDFFSPEQAAEVVAEVTGPDGVLPGFELRRDRPFARREFAVDATFDLSGGIDTFGDDDLAAVLDGFAVGVDTDALASELGGPLSEATSFTVRVHLPGGTAFNENDAELSAVDGRQVYTWTAALDDQPTPVSARTRDLDVPAVTLAGLATMAFIALVVLGALGIIRSRR